MAGGSPSGRKVDIRQPRLPRLTWIVTELDAGRQWTWTNTSPGATAVARHELTQASDGRTVVRLSIGQRGVLGRPVGWLLRRRTRRYLRMEAEGLRQRCQAESQVAGE